MTKEKRRGLVLSIFGLGYAILMFLIAFERPLNYDELMFLSSIGAPSFEVKMMIYILIGLGIIMLNVFAWADIKKARSL